MNNQEIIAAMKEKGIEFRHDVTAHLLQKAEEYYAIRFPGALVDLYLEGMPIGRKFPNWIDFSADNIRKIKKMLRFPERSIRDEDEDKYPENAPKLIPVYGHRYMPSVEGLSDAPVLSIYGLDIIYYGRNLENYLEIEFLGKDRESIWDDAVSIIPGWDDLIG